MKTWTHIRDCLFHPVAPVLIALLLCGCGGGGGSYDAGPETEPRAAATTSFRMETDTYGLQQPNFLAVSENGLGLVLRAEIADSEQDLWFDTNVLRIDCPAGLSAGVYDLAADESVCRLTIFNGFESTYLETVAGTLEVFSSENRFSGRFEALFVDHYLEHEPMNWLSGSFSATIDTGEKINGATEPVPTGADEMFAELCSSCHRLEELSRKGGYLTGMQESDVTHRSIMPEADDIHALKVLLNAAAPGVSSIPPRSP